MKNEPVTLGDWNEAREYNESLPLDQQEDFPAMEYEDGCEPDEIMVFATVVSPHFEQTLTDRYIPEVDLNYHLAKKELTRTSHYHDWTSKLTEIENRSYTYEDFGIADAEEFIKEINAIYPVSITYKLKEEVNHYDDQDIRYRVVFNYNID